MRKWNLYPRHHGLWIVLLLLLTTFLPSPLLLAGEAADDPSVTDEVADDVPVKDEVADDVYITDEAGLLSDAEITDLTAACKKVYEQLDTLVVILTTNSIGDTSRERYLEDYYDAHLAPHSYYATALVLINMDPDDRGIEIQGYGEAKYWLDGYTIETLLDGMITNLLMEYYHTALMDYIHCVEEAMVPREESSSSDQGMTYEWEDEVPFYLQTWFSLLLALVVAVVAVSIMAYHSGGKMTVDGTTYLNAKRSQLLARHDRYLHTTLTKRPKPKNESSGGGGRSPGGHSHSGGGRNF